jgi:hypothetical protein
MDKKTWILGAPDPEMEAIEALLRRCHQGVRYAAIEENDQTRRVKPHEAYRYTMQFSKDKEHAPLSAPIFVECAPSSGGGERHVIVDHHNPGDPGFGREPRDYFDASSLGQVVRRLVEMGYGPFRAKDVAQWQLIAAADHCLAAAYRGECPGVDPQRLMEWRAESRAKFQNTDPAEILRRVDAAYHSISAAPTVELAPGLFAFDVRGMRVSELPEAAARWGFNVLADSPEVVNGRVKVNFFGDERNCAAFEAVWAPQHGVTEVYGDPKRGLMGGWRKV